MPRLRLVGEEVEVEEEVTLLLLMAVLEVVETEVAMQLQQVMTGTVEEVEEERILVRVEMMEEMEVAERLEVNMTETN